MNLKKLNKRKRIGRKIKAGTKILAREVKADIKRNYSCFGSNQRIFIETMPIRDDLIPKGAVYVLALNYKLHENGDLHLDSRIRHSVMRLIKRPVTRGYHYYGSGKAPQGSLMTLVDYDKLNQILGDNSIALSNYYENNNGYQKQRRSAETKSR